MKREQANLPKHVGIIMDGNRRWAKKKGLSAIGGHNYVVDKVIEPLIDHCAQIGIPYLTLWAFSTENWSRDREEVAGIMALFRRALERKAKELVEKGARLSMLGDLERFPPDIARQFKEWMERSKENTKITVTFALNYGGRDEIVRAVKKVLANGVAGDPEKVTEEVIARYLDTAGMPDPDLVIRTGGNFRLSGFLPWQSVYSELYFTDTLMPEFGIEEFDRALEDYTSRERRFGGGSFRDYNTK